MNKFIRKTALYLMALAFFVVPAYAEEVHPFFHLPEGNTTIESFTVAKKHMRKIYKNHPETFYCKAKFDEKGNVELPAGFATPKYEKRTKRIEWEHVVPAENFGRHEVAWREGHPLCVDKKGKPFKGRKCAELVSQDFRRAQADLFNLVPSVGAVNALRSNYGFTEFFAGIPNTFGSCEMKIQGRKVEPPKYSKGMIARTYFYFESAYSWFKISDQMRRIFVIWNAIYPVDEWECKRAEEIAKIQKSKNEIVMRQCKIHGFM